VFVADSSSSLTFKEDKHHQKLRADKPSRELILAPKDPLERRAHGNASRRRCPSSAAGFGPPLLVNAVGEPFPEVP
jgi:hypothetical protein